MSAKINFLGDIALFSKFEEMSIDPFEFISFPESDINIGNFEFPIPKNHRTSFFYDVQDRYKVSYDYFKKLSLNRFDYLGLANNHILDYGKEGAEDTIQVLKDKKIKTFGFSKSKKFSPVCFVCNGISFCILGVVKNGRWSNRNFGFGPDEYCADNIIRFVKSNVTKYDHIIIYPHWGTELVSIPNKEDIINARKFIDAGASAVIGHHPHVVQGIEKYRCGLIAYSLGSFIYIADEEIEVYENELSERNISLCLNITFDKNLIMNFETHYYKYSSFLKLPEPCYEGVIKEYSFFLDRNINNQKIFSKKVRNILFKREMICFWERFKKEPVKTMIHYFSYIKMDHLKKILNF